MSTAGRLLVTDTSITTSFTIILIVFSGSKEILFSARISPRYFLAHTTLVLIVRAGWLYVYCLRRLCLWRGSRSLGPHSGKPHDSPFWKTATTIITSTTKIKNISKTTNNKSLGPQSGEPHGSVQCSLGSSCQPIAAKWSTMLLIKWTTMGGWESPDLDQERTTTQLNTNLPLRQPPSPKL